MVMVPSSPKHRVLHPRRSMSHRPIFFKFAHHILAAVDNWWSMNHCGVEPVLHGVSLTNLKQIGILLCRYLCNYEQIRKCRLEYCLLLYINQKISDSRIRYVGCNENNFINAWTSAVSLAIKVITVIKFNIIIECPSCDSHNSFSYHCVDF